MKSTLALFVFLIAQLCSAQFDEKFYQPSKTMKPIENVDYSEFRIPVENDTISGIYLKPEKVKASILFFHGAGGNVSTYLFMTKPLVEAGYQVFMIDFRGYGKSTGKPTHQNIEKDGQQFLNYAFNSGKTKGKPVIIYGASMGSQIATHLAKKNQDQIDALVLDGGISSFNAIASYYAPQYESHIKNIPFPYSAEEDIKEITIPKLLIHSKDDSDVPIQQAQKVFENAPLPKFFLNYDGEHLEALVKNKEEVLKQINALIKE